MTAPETRTTAPTAPDPDLPLLTMQSAFDKLLDSGRVEAVYGDPVTNGDTIVIPAAEVLSGMGIGIGFGGGSGTMPSQEDKEGGKQPEGSGFGGGGGGGGRVLSRPVAVIVIRPNGVVVQPVFDITKIGLAALTAMGFMAGAMATMSSRRRAMRAIKGE